MSEQSVKFKAGNIIVFSEGEYSDYHYTGHFVALCDVTHDEVVSLCATLKEREAVSAESSPYGYADYERQANNSFIPACIRNGWLVSIDASVQEIHIGSYGKLDIS